MSIEVAAGLLLKMIGAFAGAVLALIFVPPKTLNGFIRRGTFALVSGPILGPYVQGWAGFSDGWEGLVAASSMAAFVSWWLAGSIKRAADLWKPPSAGQED